MINKREILVHEVDAFDEIEQRVKDEVANIVSDPALIDTLFNKGKDEFKVAIMSGLSDKLTKEIDDAIALGKLTAKKLK